MGTYYGGHTSSIEAIIWIGICAISHRVQFGPTYAGMTGVMPAYAPLVRWHDACHASVRFGLLSPSWLGSRAVDYFVCISLRKGKKSEDYVIRRRLCDCVWDSHAMAGSARPAFNHRLPTNASSHYNPCHGDRLYRCDPMRMH